MAVSVAKRGEFFVHACVCVCVCVCVCRVEGMLSTLGDALAVRDDKTSAAAAVYLILYDGMSSSVCVCVHVCDLL